MSVFGELQLAQISLDFKTSCCNLKIRGDVWEQNCVWLFLLFEFWKELWRFTVKESTHFVEKNIDFNFLYRLFCPNKFFLIMCFISMYSVLNTLSEYAYFYISKNITSYTF